MLAVDQSDFSTNEQSPERAQRKNLMLAAQFEGEGGQIPIRIRNLSQSGAMVDGTGLPRVGAKVVMVRLGLRMKVTVIWREDGRCGVQFDHLVDIEDWVTGVQRDGAIAGGQARVDQVQQALRGNAPQTAQFVPAQVPINQSALLMRQSNDLIAQELMLVKHMLDAISGELSENIEVLMKHERALQNCDIAAAILEQVAKVVNADDRAGAIAKVNMHEVKARLSGRPTLT